MKLLVIGGVKSGKSRHAEQLCLEIAQEMRPVYLATTEIIDAEMRQRIQSHKDRRKERFLTIEEPLAIAAALKKTAAPGLVECLTMWLNNMLYHQRSETDIFAELETLMSLPNPLVMVLNEVGCGVIPENALSRQFVDLSGKVSQWLGDRCDQVYLCVAGQRLAMKHANNVYSGTGH